MTSDEQSGSAILEQLPPGEILQINVSNYSSDTEEIEAEPQLRPERKMIRAASHPSLSSENINLFPKSISSSDSISVGQSTNDVESSNHDCDFQPPKSDEFRERRRTAYSYNSSSLSEKTKKVNVKPDNSSKNDPTENNSPSAGFSCNICFDTACNPVLTLCGHLFCWPCLHRWLTSQFKNPLCPVCKAGCGKDKVIPVYGRGSDEKDPRLSESIPERPKGQRPKPQPAPGYGGWSRVFGRGFDAEGFPGAEASTFNFQAGFGFFPALTFQYTAETGAQFHTHAGSPQQAFLFRLFLMLAILVFIANLLG